MLSLLFIKFHGHNCMYLKEDNHLQSFFESILKVLPVVFLVLIMPFLDKIKKTVYFSGALFLQSGSGYGTVGTE